MEITETSKGDVTILSLSGEIWGRKNEPEQFQAKIEQLIRDSKVRVVVNLSQVRLISSVGIGMLIGGLKRLSKAGGNLVLAAPSDPIKPVFRVLKGPLEQFKTEAEAIASMQSPGD